MNKYTGWKEGVDWLIVSPFDFRLPWLVKVWRLYVNGKCLITVSKSPFSKRFKIEEWETGAYYADVDQAKRMALTILSHAMDTEMGQLVRRASAVEELKKGGSLTLK